MKFSELDEAEWAALQPYLDTCLLPVSGLTGDEAPWEMTERAARTGEWLYPIEQAFKGRTVTLPAYHYHNGSKEASEALSRLCERHRLAGFRYVVLVCGHAGLLQDVSGADLIVCPRSEDEQPDPEELRHMVSVLWRNTLPERHPSPPSGQA